MPSLKNQKGKYKLNSPVYRRAVLLFSTLMALMFVSLMPAQAAGLVGTTTINYQPRVAVSNTFYDLYNKKYVVTSYLNTTNRLANSVYVNSIDVCFNGPAGSAAYISPYTTNSAGTNYWDSGPAYQLYNGYCHHYVINRTYYKQSDNEVIRIVNRITGPTGKVQTVAGFYR